MYRIISSSEPVTRCLLSSLNNATHSRLVQRNCARAFQGFGGKKHKSETADENASSPSASLPKDGSYEDSAIQRQVESAWMQGYAICEQKETPAPKPGILRVIGFGFGFGFGSITGFVGGLLLLSWLLGKNKGADKDEKGDSATPVKGLPPVNMQAAKMDIKQTNPEEIKVRFTDVKGVDEAKEELQLIVDFLKNPEKYSRLGGKMPKGVLLVGNPGVGKTLLAKAVAGEAGVPFFYASGSEFNEVYIGMGALRVRQLFAAAKKAQPCVLFIDEIDSCGGKRTSSSMHPFANQTVNQMLTEMDGFTKNSGVIVLGATNQRSSLDEALLRPGRFDVEVNVPLPDVKGREEVLRYYMSRVKVAPNLDIEAVAKGTPGFSASELENLVNQAAINAAKRRRIAISTDDIEWAKDKLTMGSEKKGKVFDAQTLRNTAYHEAGHTLVAYFTEGSHPIHKVTIIPRGQSLGHTAFVPNTESNQTKAQLKALLDVAMGGRIGEQLLDDERKINKGVTTGASSDFNRATAVATSMVKRFGMSPLVGMRVFSEEMEDVSDVTKKTIDAEIKRLMDESYDRAAKLLQIHAEGHRKLAEALIAKETLDADEIKAILGPKAPKAKDPNESKGRNGQKETQEPKESKETNGQKELPEA